MIPSMTIASPKVHIVIVTWNSKRFIKNCLDSVFSQSYKNFSLVVIDNHSSDGTLPFIREKYPHVSILENFRNVGYAKANNQGIQLSKAPYILILNPDVILEPDFLEKIVSAAEQRPRYASFTGKILKLKISQQEADIDEDYTGVTEFQKSDVVDTAGLIIYKNRRVLNRGEGEKDKKQFEKNEEVFGVSGCCALFRREALEDVRIHNEYFDEDFFAYKEDIDIAWRLRLYGWKSLYVPNARAYHYRGVSRPQGKSVFRLIQSQKKIHPFLRFLSLRNHHLMMIKNEIPSHFMMCSIPILLRELQLLFSVFIFRPSLLWAYRDVLRNMPKMFRKRKIIMRRRVLNRREIVHWFQ